MARRQRGGIIQGICMQKEEAMKPKEKIVDFSQYKNLNEQLPIEDDCFDIYEDWEGDYDLISKEDYTGLIKYRMRVAKSNPNDIESLWPLGEAYILNKEYEKGIEYLTPLHQKYPEHIDIQYCILDAIYAIGKIVDEYKWIIKPIIFRLNEEIADQCYEFLKGKRKARSIDEIYCELISLGYLTFNQNELYDYLQKNARFEIENGSINNKGLIMAVKQRKR